MKTKKTPTKKASTLYAEHAAAIHVLLGRIPGGLTDCRAADWTMVATAAHIRSLLVEVAFAAGQITVDEAHEQHGVTL